MRNLCVLAVCLLLVVPCAAEVITADHNDNISNEGAISPLFDNQTFSNDFTARGNASYKRGELIVRFADKADGKPRNVQEKKQILSSRGLGGIKRNFKAVPSLSLVKLPRGMTVEKAVKQFNKASEILYAEPDYKVKALSTFPNDPRFNELWGLHNTGQSGGKADADIDAPEAWARATGSGEIIVAVIDTGVDYTHPDLAANMWTNEAELNGIAGVDDDGNGYVDDIYGYDFYNNDGDPMDDHYHGTHVAGTIGAVGNNGTGVAGVCWDVKIMSLKFLDSTGNGWTSDAISCIEYSILMGANVTSNSWGGGGYNQALKDAIDAAGAAGMLFVAAAGNDSVNNDVTAHYPSSFDCESLIAVMSTDRNDNRSGFSNYGPNSVDIGAPGSSILSCRPGGGYRYLNGTSMATPHVAGACALVWSVAPEFSNTLVKNILLQTTDAILPGLCVSQGRLNLSGAMDFIFSSQGYISLDLDYYSCSGVVSVFLTDYDLAGQGSQEVVLTTDGGDLETLVLQETSSGIGIFNGTISTATRVFGRPRRRPRGRAPRTENGKLEISHDEVITVVYADEDDGTGEQAMVSDTATADCEEPIVFNIELDVPGPEPTVTFETDEPTTVRVLCSTKRRGPSVIEWSSLTFATSHTIKLIGVMPETDYFFVIEATDMAGNVTLSDDNGKRYEFTTTGPGDIYVPSQYETIQEAIDRSWDSGIVWVADGTYSGQGNCDIDFKGKAITVKSENGPGSCIIDCQGSETEPHRGFYSQRGETADSIVDGFTITNGYATWGSPGGPYGGGIYCSGSSPTITNCIITKNTAEFGAGGGIFCTDGSPTISNCIISGNNAMGAGGI